MGDRAWAPDPVGSRPSQSPSRIPGRGAPPPSHTPRGTCHFKPRQGACGSPAPMWATWEVTKHSLHRMPGGTRHRMAPPGDWHCFYSRLLELPLLCQAQLTRCERSPQSGGRWAGQGLSPGLEAEVERRVLEGLPGEWLEQSTLSPAQPSCRVCRFLVQAVISLSVPLWAAPPPLSARCVSLDPSASRGPRSSLNLLHLGASFYRPEYPGSHSSFPQFMLEPKSCVNKSDSPGWSAWGSAGKGPWNPISPGQSGSNGVCVAGGRSQDRIQSPALPSCVHLQQRSSKLTVLQSCLQGLMKRGCWAQSF